MLQIRKKLQNVFKHFDTDLGDFLLSKGYFKIGKGKFQIIEDGGARRMLYSLSEITVYDDTASGFPETFLTDVALYNRLFELGYNLIDYNGVNPSTPTVYATESPIDSPFTGSNTFELPLNYILISVFLDVDLRIKAEYIRTPTGIIILDTLVSGNIISIRGFIASGSVVGGSVISVTDDDNGVVSVDNSNPTNPIVKFNGVVTDGTTVTGNGTEENPLASLGGGGVTINDETPSLTQTYSSEKSEDTFVKRSGTEVGKDIFGDLKFSNNAGLITREFSGLQSRFYENNGKWHVNIIDGIDDPTFDFDDRRGLIADKLFDIDNDEKAYIQKGHIVQLEENVFNLQLNKANQDTTYTKTEVDAKVASVYKIRGSVANFASLPSSGQVSGDVWNLLDNGDNYAWVLDLNNTGVAGWDKLSGNVDLTAIIADLSTKQTKPIIISANKTAVNDEIYHNNGNNTYTDPTPLANKGFSVKVISGTATIGGVDFGIGTIIERYYDGTDWKNEVYVSAKNQVEFSGNKTVVTTWFGKEVTCVSTGVLTIPASLPDEFNFCLRADAGVSISWAITSPHTWRVMGLAVGVAPATMTAGQFCQVSKRKGTNEIRLSGL